MVHSNCIQQYTTHITNQHGNSKLTVLRGGKTTPIINNPVSLVWAYYMANSTSKVECCRQYYHRRQYVANCYSSYSYNSNTCHYKGYRHLQQRVPFHRQQQRHLHRQTTQELTSLLCQQRAVKTKFSYEYLQHLTGQNLGNCLVVRAKFPFSHMETRHHRQP